MTADKGKVEMAEEQKQQDIAPVAEDSHAHPAANTRSTEEHEARYSEEQESELIDTKEAVGVLRFSCYTNSWDL